MEKLQLGFHVSISGSIDLAIDRAKESGCTTFQIFTRNPRGWKYKQLDSDEIALFIEKRKKAGFTKVIAHMPYLPNLATPMGDILKKSRASLKEEVKRCASLGIDYLVVHLGSHMGKGSMVGVRNVAEACDEALEDYDGETNILLENMAGQKNSVGSRFEELRLIVERVERREKIAICFDSCHAYAAGFDLSTKTGIVQTMELFDQTLGLDQIKVVHLNDSKWPLGSNLDRHEHIGMGNIGERGFRDFLRYDGITKLPIIMETPVDDRRSDAENLRVVKKLLSP
jgi:deoxyribonuclease-4